MACGWVTVSLSVVTGAGEAVPSLVVAGELFVSVLSLAGAGSVLVLVSLLLVGVVWVPVPASVVVVPVVDEGAVAVAAPTIPGSLLTGNWGRTSHIHAMTCIPGADNCWLADVIGGLLDILKQPNPNDDAAICISAADHCAEIFRSLTTIIALGTQRKSPWLFAEFSPVE